MKILLFILFFGVLFYQLRSKPMDVLSKGMLYSFYAIWAVALFFSVCEFYDLNSVSYYTYLIMAVNIVSFSIGFGLKKQPQVYSEVDTSLNSVCDKMDCVLESKIFRITMIVATMYVYTLLVVFFDRVVMYSMSDVRTMYFDDVNELYGMAYSKVNFILSPLVILCYPLFAYSFLKRRDWLTIVLGIYLFGYESLGAGRFGYVRIALSVLFILILLKDRMNEKESATAKRFLVIFSAAFLILFVIVTGTRTVSSQVSKENFAESIDKTAEQVVTYMAGPIAAFDYSVEHDYVGKMGGYQHGSLTGSGFIALANLFTLRLGHPLNMPLGKLAAFKQGDGIGISRNGGSYNALYTSNLIFYLDFGFIGVLFLPFLLGFIVRYFIVTFYSRCSFFVFVILCFLFLKMMLSVFDYFLYSPYEILDLVVFFILSKTSLDKRLIY